MGRGVLKFKGTRNMTGGGWGRIGALLLAAGALAGAAPQDAGEGEVRLTLRGAFLRKSPSGSVPRDLALDLRLEDGRWLAEAWGYADGFNLADHEGRVRAREEGEKIRLEVELTVHPDPWVPGGTASYEIELARDGASLAGSFTGTFNGAPVRGMAAGRALPYRPAAFSGHATLRGGEHPRLVFRKSDLPALREKAKTREGQAILARLRPLLARPAPTSETGGFVAAGHGLLHLVAREERSAAQARDLVDKVLRDRLPGPALWRPGARMVQRVPAVVGVALAYDLCYDAWDAEFRERVARELEAKVLEILRGGGPGYALEPGSHWNAILRGGAGVAALAILDDPCAFTLPEPQDSETRDAWERAREEWLAGGKASTEAARAARVCLRSVRRYLEHSVGDRGGLAEGDDAGRQALVHGLLPFFVAYRTVTGEDVAAGTGAEGILPLFVGRAVRRGGSLWASHYGPGSEGWERSFLRSGEFAMGWGAVSERARPAVLWAFNRAFGLEGDRTFDIFLPHHAIYALAHYPAGLAARNPAELLPRALADARSGFFLFRREWKGEDDIVAAITARTRTSPDAGSFRIAGFGAAWARLAGGRSARADRSDENVLQAPGLLGWGPARVAHFRAEGDGSGAVTLSMDEVYRDEKDQDAGVRGFRAFAADYSGRSGAPALFVVVDRLKGGPEKVWTLHAEGEIKAEGKQFTILGPKGATLRGTFLAPADPQLAVKGGSLLAMGGDEYFVVMTLQKGPAPAVESEGAGLDAKAKVGPQRVRFDGEKFVFEP